MSRGKNEVVLTFSGDADQLERTFDKVGESADKMEGKVTEAGKGFDKVGEAADAVDTKAMGFRDTLTGVQDTMGGVSQIAKGDLFGGFMTLGAGIGDLGSGFYNFLIPSLKSTVGWLGKTKAGMLAQAAAAKVVGAATKVWTGIQWLFNAAMLANPVTWIIIGIIALIAVIVLIATKTDWFQKLWSWIWGKIGDPVKAVWEWIKNTLWPGIQLVWTGIVEGAKLVWEGIKKYFNFWKGLLDKVIGWVKAVWTKARDDFNRIVEFVKGLPGRIRSAASGMFNGIRDAFKNALNWIIDRWNGLSFTLPSVTVFGKTIGGMTLHTPDIPRFHTGGHASGAHGGEFLALLQAGERITPKAGGEQRTVLEVRSAGGRLDDLLVEILSRAVAVRGGDVQLVLGGARG